MSEQIKKVLVTGGAGFIGMSINYRHGVAIDCVDVFNRQIINQYLNDNIINIINYTG
jgi:dTDP-D-glucose 4,6-dehydratase